MSPALRGDRAREANKPHRHRTHHRLGSERRGSIYGGGGCRRCAEPGPYRKRNIRSARSTPGGTGSGRSSGPVAWGSSGWRSRTPGCASPSRSCTASMRRTPSSGPVSGRRSAPRGGSAGRSPRRSWTPTRMPCGPGWRRCSSRGRPCPNASSGTARWAPANCAGSARGWRRPCATSIAWGSCTAISSQATCFWRRTARVSSTSGSRGPRTATCGRRRASSSAHRRSWHRSSSSGRGRSAPRRTCSPWARCWCTRRRGGGRSTRTARTSWRTRWSTTSRTSRGCRRNWLRCCCAAWRRTRRSGRRPRS